VEEESDTLKIKELQAKIAELERMLGQKEVQLTFQNKLIEIAESTYGIDIKKKLWYDTVTWFWQHREELSVSLNFFYKAIGYSKQSLHQYLDRQLKELEECGYLEVIIHQIRKRHPTMSFRYMYELINPEVMGRDKFILYCTSLEGLVKLQV
jgi:tyrosine-protein phosphatase YwqE